MTRTCASSTATRRRWPSSALKTSRRFWRIDGMIDTVFPAVRQDGTAVVSLRERVAYTMAHGTCEFEIDALLRGNRCINSIVRNMSQAEQNQLSPLGILSC